MNERVRSRGSAAE